MVSFANYLGVPSRVAIAAFASVLLSFALYASGQWFIGVVAFALAGLIGASRRGRPVRERIAYALPASCWLVWSVVQSDGDLNASVMNGGFIGLLAGFVAAGVVLSWGRATQ